MPAVHRRAAIAIGGAALLCGIAGLVAARGLAFTAPRGALVGTLMSFNAFGALVTVVLAAVALSGAWFGRRALVAAAGGLFALAAVLQLVQAGGDPNLLGGRPSTFSFFLFCAAGLVVVGRIPVWRASD